MSVKFPKLTIRDVAKPTSMRNPAARPNEEITYVDIASVSNKDFKISTPKNLLGRDAPSRARKVIIKNDVLIATTRPYLRTMALVPEEFDNQICSTGFCVVRANELVLADWLFYFCLSDQFMRQLLPLMRGATYPAVTDKDILNAQIPVPSLPEQRRIVARIKECMERVEETQNLRAESIIESKQLASAIYESIESEGNWPSKSVGEVIIGSKNGRSISQDNSNPTGFVLSLSSVREVFLDQSFKKPIQLPSSISEEFCIRRGDVFVSRANTRELVGLASIAEASHSGLIYPDLLIKLEANPLFINPRFLAYALRTRSSRLQIKDRAVGSSQSMVKISAQRLKEVKIKVPPLKKQDEILDKLEEARNLISSTIREFSEDHTQNLRDAILRKAFSGEF